MYVVSKQINSPQEDSEKRTKNCRVEASTSSVCCFRCPGEQEGFISSYLCWKFLSHFKKDDPPSPSLIVGRLPCNMCCPRGPKSATVANRHRHTPASDPVESCSDCFGGRVAFGGTMKSEAFSCKETAQQNQTGTTKKPIVL